MDAHGFRITNRCLPDMIRAMDLEEIYAVRIGVVVDEGGCLLISGSDKWECYPEGENYRFTLPDGRTGTGTTVAEALAAARLA